MTEPQEKPSLAGLHKRLSELDEVVTELFDTLELIQDAVFGTDVRPHLAGEEEVTSE